MSNVPNNTSECPRCGGGPTTWLCKCEKERTMIDWLIGNDQALFNKWSIVHAASGFLLAVNLTWLTHLTMLPTMLIVFACSIAWEVIEIYIEKARGDTPEGWLNRWAGDHVSVLVGALLGILFKLL